MKRSIEAELLGSLWFDNDVWKNCETLGIGKFVTLQNRVFVKSSFAIKEMFELKD
jgi:hypothetical protein|tara:strand:+ start:1547 stop:1711 length:165 start_codon:yes stop_codon:yes gene_type:complete